MARNVGATCPTGSRAKSEAERSEMVDPLVAQAPPLRLVSRQSSVLDKFSRLGERRRDRVESAFGERRALSNRGNVP
jgi:hypothetical protein